MLAPAKSALQLLPGQLHDGRPAVNIVGRKVGSEQPQQQLSHLSLLQPLARLYRRATGVRCRKPLEAVRPTAESASSKIGDHLAETGLGIEPRMGSRHGVHHDGPSSKPLYLEPYPPELLTVRLDGIQLFIGQLHR
jgi:hypothetical protein